MHQRHVQDAVERQRRRRPVRVFGRRPKSRPDARTSSPTGPASSTVPSGPFQPGAVHDHRKGRPVNPSGRTAEADRARRAVLRTRDEPSAMPWQLPTNGDDGLGFGASRSQTAVLRPDHLRHDDINRGFFMTILDLPVWLVGVLVKRRCRPGVSRWSTAWTCSSSSTAARSTTSHQRRSGGGEMYDRRRPAGLRVPPVRVLRRIPATEASTLVLM